MESDFPREIFEEYATLGISREEFVEQFGEWQKKHVGTKKWEKHCTN